MGGGGRRGPFHSIGADAIAIGVSFVVVAVTDGVWSIKYAFVLFCWFIVQHVLVNYPKGYVSKPFIVRYSLIVDLI